MSCEICVCADGIVSFQNHHENAYQSCDYTRTVQTVLEGKQQKENVAWLYLPESTIVTRKFEVLSKEAKFLFVLTVDGVYILTSGECTAPTFTTNALQKMILEEMLIEFRIRKDVGCGGKVVVLRKIYNKPPTNFAEADLNNLTTHDTKRELRVKAKQLCAESHMTTANFPSEKICKALQIDKAKSVHIDIPNSQNINNYYLTVILWLNLLPKGDDERKSICMYNSGRLCDKWGSTNGLMYGTEIFSFCSLAPTIVFCKYGDMYRVSMGGEMQKLRHNMAVENKFYNHNILHTNSGYTVFILCEFVGGGEGWTVHVQILPPDKIEPVCNPCLFTNVRHVGLVHGTGSALQNNYLYVILETGMKRIYRICKRLDLVRVGSRQTHTYAVPDLCYVTCSDILCGYLPFRPDAVRFMCKEKRKRVLHMLCIIHKLKTQVTLPVLPWELWLFILEVYSDHVI